MLLVLGPPFRDRESLKSKQTKVKPNPNRGWSKIPVNHIRPQLTRLCQNSSWTPTSQNADGALPYWQFQRYAPLRIANIVKRSIFGKTSWPAYQNFLHVCTQWKDKTAFHLQYVKEDHVVTAHLFGGVLIPYVGFPFVLYDIIMYTFLLQWMTDAPSYKHFILRSSLVTILNIK